MGTIDFPIQSKREEVFLKTKICIPLLAFLFLISMTFAQGVANPSGDTKQSLIAQALSIIETHLDIGSDLVGIRSAGNRGEVMRAAVLLKQACDLAPADDQLRYARISALRLAAQFKTAGEELNAFIRAKPGFALARYSAESWSGNETIAPSVFCYPVWTPTTTTVPEMYAKHIKTFILFPARDGIYPRAVVFERDTDGWWTPSRLKDVKTDIAIVLSRGMLNVAALYRGINGPGLNKIDVQESLHVIEFSRSDVTSAGWEFLCEQSFIDVVILDANDSILLNQRVTLTEQAKSTLKEVRALLLASPGRDVPHSESLPILRAFQNGIDLDAIANKYFRK